MFSFFKRRKRALRAEPSVADLRSIPTIQIDRRLITQAVRDDLSATIASVEDIPHSMKDGLYREALNSAPKRDLHSLAQYILDLRLNNMPEARAAEIARLIANSTGAFMTKERQISIGIKEALWMHSGARCGISPEFAIAAAHCAANGKKYSVDTGLLIEGKHVWPGREAGCKCASKAIVKGFS
jgi:hypothetical protein